MADEISIEDIQRKQAEMATLAAQITGEKDAAKIQAVAAALQRQTEELQRMGRAFEVQQHDKHGPPKPRGTEVALTEEQRKRVEAQTGVAVESVWLRDDSGAAASAEPRPDPRIIEDAALEEARRREREAEAEAQTRTMAERVLAQIEGVSAAAAAKVAELKADPNFLGGILARKK